MNAFTKALNAVRLALKSFTMRFSGYGGRWSLLLGRTRYDYAADVGDGTRNSIVIACVNWICRTFPEAPVQVVRIGSDGKREVLRDHPMVTLVERPNSFYSGPLLWMATLLDWTVSGNAYWVKVRSAAGRVVQLWWVPQSLIEPKWPLDGSEFISHYEYTPDGRVIRLEPSDVVHFRHGLDPRNPRKGLSPLASLFREIFTDDEAANFSASLLRNLGIPGVIIAPNVEYAEITREDAEAIKAEFQQKFAGDRRGEPLVMPSRVSVQTLSFSPEQLNLEKLRRIPEERVAAVLGIPAVVAGLGAGLDRATYSNLKESREAAYESNIIPTQRLLAAELQTQLLPDFGDTTGLHVQFDLSAVRVLQEDQNALWQRMELAVRGGWVTVAEARAAVGLPAGPEHEVYLRPLSTVEIAAQSTGTKGRTATKALVVIEQKGSADRQMIERLRREEERLAERFAQDLSRAFEELADEVLARIREHGKARKATEDDWPEILQTILVNDGAVEVLLPPRWKDQFQRVYQHHWTLIAETTFGTVSERLGIDVSWSLQDPECYKLILEGGRRITQIDEQTRQAIVQALRDGREAGDGAEALGRRIRGYVEGRNMYPGVYQRAYDAARERGWGHEAAERAGDRAARQFRAETIARTETKTAQNLSSVAAYRKSEVVQALRVFDGLDCGWSSHDDPVKADGMIVSFDEAHAQPLSHPRCVRNFAPVVREL